MNQSSILQNFDLEKQLDFAVEEEEVEEQKIIELIHPIPVASNTSIKSWWIIVQANKTSPYKQRREIYEKALESLSGCYKIWYNYLIDSIQSLSKASIISYKYEQINQLFERALVYMHKMPRIWLVYAEFLQKQCFITKTRQTFDRALASLPVSQHEKIWEDYKKWALTINSLRTTKSILRRYLQINQDFKEDYVNYLLEKEDYDEAAIYLKKILDDDSYASQSGKSKYQFLMDLCNLISKYPDKIVSLDCEAVIRQGISKYTDEIGTMWICLGDYYIRQGLFDKARLIFETALDCVLTARDFGIVFNAYVKFEEEMLTLISTEEEDEDPSFLKDSETSSTINKILGLPCEEFENLTKIDLDYRIQRLEKLLERRPLLLNNCLLRQNKNNIKEWLKRLELQMSSPKQYLQTIADAICQIDPQKAENGNLSEIWIKFANFYLQNGDLKNANLVFDRATKVNFKTQEDTIKTWLLWAEMLIESGYPKDALNVTKNALFNRKRGDKGDEKEKRESFESHNVQIWSLYLDLEQNLGSFETLSEAYRRVINLKVITPYMLINYTNLLEKNRFFEESFKIFEMGISLFEWPSCYEIWILYLNRFISRYKGSKLERCRDLFEKVLEKAPKNMSKVFYMMYAEFEEKYGLLNHAIEIYDRMASNIDDKMLAYSIYIGKVAEFLGITKSRPIFESALNSLKDEEIVEMGLRFALLEKKLGEIDRVRSIYSHISQFCDPNYDSKLFWKKWEDFELHHGNVDTYSEYKKIWRSVLGKFTLNPPDAAKMEVEILKAMENKEEEKEN